MYSKFYINIYFLIQNGKTLFGYLTKEMYSWLNSFNHMVISELHAKLIQQLNKDEEGQLHELKVTMNDFVSRLCLLFNVFLNARVKSGCFLLGCEPDPLRIVIFSVKLNI